jgi:hypothetical protein
VQIVSLEPVNSSTLVANEPFYVHVKYSTDQPVNLWAYPYFHGKPVKSMLTGASSKYVGDGETIGWFALTEPGKVDEIRIVVGGGEPWRQWPVARRRLALTWVAEPSSPQTAASSSEEPQQVASAGKPAT